MNNNPDKNKSRFSRVKGVIKPLNGLKKPRRIIVAIIIIIALAVGAAFYVLKYKDSATPPVVPPTKPPAANDLPESAPPEGVESIEVLPLPPDDAKVKKPELPGTG